MTHRLFLFTLLLSGAAAGVSCAGDEPPLANPRPEVEARGPLHEAFAQPWVKDPEASPIVPKRPPAPVAEEPPDQRPQGNNVQWLPGYWHWDDERKDFLWISGFWRDVPDGRRWVVGYWAETNDGWRWVSGHWAAAQEPDHQTVPEPPLNLDEGPSTPAPDNNSFYIPGSWFYTEDGWRWRPGYWADVRPDYSWVPASYTWTPGGYSFCSGYWDYAPFRRGLLFAPVYWGPRPYFPLGFLYRPSFFLETGFIFSSLWVRPGFNFYYFGNYYGGGYLGLGYRPWFAYSARYYDPLYSYQRWAHRNDPLWLTNMRTTYDGRVAGRVASPPRTLADQAKVAAATTLGSGLKGTSAMRSPAVVAPLAEATRSGVKLEAVAAPQRQAITQNVQQMVNRSIEQSRTSSQLRFQSSMGLRTDPAIRSLDLGSGLRTGPGGARVGGALSGNTIGRSLPTNTVPRSTNEFMMPRSGNFVPTSRPQGFNPGMNRPPASMPHISGGGFGRPTGGGGGGRPSGGGKSRP